MSERIYNVLFICTHNSARSVMGEAIMNRLGQGRFRGYSAGASPSGEINPLVLDLLRRENYIVDQFRSKSLDEFTGPDAIHFDFIFTVCNDAATKTYPMFPGHAMKAHWGLPDPSAVIGKEAEKRAAIAEVYKMMYTRIGVFVNLPMTALDKLNLQQHLDDIGQN